MAHKRKRIFDGLYAQLEETDGNVVLFSARGEPSVIFEITNPVQQLCTDAQQYMLFHDVLSNILQTIGEGYALQKQDIMCRQAYHHDVPDDAEFLTRSYFRYFEGREFTEIRTFLILTQEAQRSQFIQYDPKRWLDFHSKVSKTDDILTEKHIRHRKLGKEEVSEYCHRFMAFQFRHGPFSMTNFKASDEYLRTGDRIIRSYPLVDIDEINLPSMIKPYTQMNINGYGIATDLLSFLTGASPTRTVWCSIRSFRYRDRGSCCASSRPRRSVTVPCRTRATVLQRPTLRKCWTGWPLTVPCLCTATSTFW